jgi:lysophospholipase L1-like esterase
MADTGGRGSGRLAALLAAVGGLLLGMVACELLLRIAAPLPDRYFLYRPHTRLTFRFPPGELPGVEGDSHFTINSIGLRSDELAPDAAFRVLAIGGSTTLDAYLDQPETWTHLLQERLNGAQDGVRVWVGNAGRSGHRTREHRLQARHLLEDLPKMDVVLLLVGANDMLRRLAEDARYDPDFFARPDAEALLLPAAFDYLPLHLRRTQPFFKRTQIWSRARQVRRLIGRFRAGREGGTVEDEAGANLLSWRANRRAALAIRDALPDLEPGLREYADNLTRIAAIVRAHGATPIFVTQPSIWRADLPEALQRLVWLGGVGEFQRAGARSEYYSLAALARAMERYNETLLEVCRREAVHCIDLAAVLPKDDRAFYDDAHFNEAGARRVADAIAAELLPRVRAAPVAASPVRSEE